MLKKIIKKIVIFLLTLEARLILKKYKPEIIAVSGTVGKTSSKDAIAIVLSSKFYVRKSEKSYNSEFGVPLTIIGVKSAWNNIFQWPLVLLKGLKVLMIKSNYPRILVLEMGVGKPHDMEELISKFKPDIGILTALGEVPVHIENFKEKEELIKEKLKLVKSLKKEHYAIINGDDNVIIENKEKIKADIISYGFNENVDIKASDYHIIFKKEGEHEIAEGITFKINYKGSIAPVKIQGTLGINNVYTALSAVGVGLVKGLNIVEISELLSRYKPPPGRLNLIEGIKNSQILDDTYNSSPLAASVAIETMKDLPAKRKIAVLGDMLELGKYTIEEHKKLGRLVKDIADILVVIGPRSIFISDEAEVVGFNKKKIRKFSDSKEAGLELKKIIKEGDIILVKGSQAIRMERVVEEIMAHPENKENLLVRQEKEWQNR